MEEVTDRSTIVDRLMRCRIRVINERGIDILDSEYKTKREGEYHKICGLYIKTRVKYKIDVTD